MNSYAAAQTNTLDNISFPTVRRRPLHISTCQRPTSTGRTSTSSMPFKMNAGHINGCSYWFWNEMFKKTRVGGIFGQAVCIILY